MKYEYTACHYVNVGGSIYTPGEIIANEMTDEQAERLLKLSAIKLTAVSEEEPVSDYQEPEEAEAETEAEEEETVMMPDAAINIDIAEGIVDAPPKKKGGRKK